jgi:hypothetical protein
MKFHYHFIPQGARATHNLEENTFTVDYNAGTRDKPNAVVLKLPADQTVILDTGNLLQPGIIDHHQPGCEYSNQCVASIVVQHAETYLRHCLGKDELHIVTHFLPDLDAISAVYFAQKYLEGQMFSAFDGLFCDYVNMVDLGKLILDPDHPVGIASLWLSHTSNVDYGIAFTQDFNKKLLQQGLSFIEAVITVTEKEENPWINHGFDEVASLQPHCDKIINDAHQYAEDFKNSVTGIVELYNAETRGFDEVEVIISREAKSFLWKYWVRGDRRNTLFKRGFVLTCLHYPNKSIISVPSNLPYHLKGLGLYIDSLEIKGLLAHKNQPELTAAIDALVTGSEGTPRVGFHRNDPWYDGRGAHNFTIIDVPRAGSLLDHETLDASIFAYRLWNEFGQKFNLTSLDVASQEALSAVEELALNERPYFNKTNDNSSLHSQIDAYHIRLGVKQVQYLLNSYVDHTHDLSERNVQSIKEWVETAGNHIEALVTEPSNDVFINSDRIKDFMMELHRISFSQYAFIVKVRHWSTLLAKYIAEGFSFFHSRAFDDQKNELVEKLEPYINPTFARTMLDVCQSLPVKSFSLLFIKIEKDIKNSDLFYSLLAYQSVFSRAFSPQSIQEFFTGNVKISSDCSDLVGAIEYEKWDEPFFEEIPLYSYNSIKNYADDLFHLLEMENPGALRMEALHEFQQTDFKQIFDVQLNANSHKSLEKLTTFFSENKQQIVKQLFGENCKNLRKAKYDIIGKIAATNKNDNSSSAKVVERQRLIKCLLDLDVKSLPNLPFDQTRWLIKNIENLNFIEDNGLLAVPESFINELKLFEELGSLEMLFMRLNRFAQMEVVCHQNPATKEDEYILGLNALTFQLARLISLYINFNDTEELEESLGLVMEILNQLKLVPVSEDRFDTAQLREKIAAFIPSISDEISLPVNDVESQIELSLKQYEALTGQGGILSLVDRLPLYYKVRLKDVFSGFKTYYKNRMSFFRMEIKALLEESETGNESKLQDQYITTCNQLINSSVAFDWQELKDKVDALGDDPVSNAVRSSFYEKYFYWLSLNKPETLEKLYELNSEIRFAEGKSKDEISAIVKNLPTAEGKNITLYELTVDFQLSQIIKHKPVNLIHNAYDFLIEHFITKYHIDNVRETLKKFSTKFPWYYRYLTDKKYLRLLFGFLLLLIVGAGAFDSTQYDGKLAPLPRWIYSHVGKFTFTAISETVHLIWGIFISMSFILPLLALFRFLYHRFVLRIKPDDSDGADKLNFFQLIQTIEGKRSHLLYIPFVIPLLIVVLQMSNPDTILLINKIEGVRFFTTLMLVVGLTILSVHNYVKEKNEKMSSSWLMQRTEHMLWLHLIQAFIISVFVIDLILRFQVSVSDFSDQNGGLYFLGMSKFIEIKRGIIDVVIMPTFTIMITILTLFFSFFIEKIFGGGNE